MGDQPEGPPPKNGFIKIINSYQFGDPGTSCKYVRDSVQFLHLASRSASTLPRAYAAYLEECRWLQDGRLTKMHRGRSVPIVNQR